MDLLSMNHFLRDKVNICIMFLPLRDIIYSFPERSMTGSFLIYLLHNNYDDTNHSFPNILSIYIF